VDEVEVVWEDDSLIVLNKPSGLPTQGSKTHPLGLYELLKQARPYVGLHHRLDQPASGLVLFTLHPRVNADIGAFFKEKKIHRSYLCVLAGQVEASQWTASLHGKAARTDVQPIGEGHGMTAARITLHTGRKHQIRLHAAEQDHPVLGDRRYGQQWGRAWPRLALHACALAFKHPLTGGTISLAIDCPDDMAELWALAGGRP
jgi:23S rRNA-/tRNA-specific pseudouridylate synthase